MTLVTDPDPRDAALRVLGEVGRGRRLDRAFASAASGLPSRERRWLQELTYGTVRLRGRVDHLLDHHLDRGVEGMDGRLLDILRLGVYQILYMGSVPDYAAVSQMVSRARAVGGRRHASLVNAVLRAVAAAGVDPALFPTLASDPVGHLSRWGSHPGWLVERWLGRWSVDEVAALVDHDNGVPPLTVLPLGLEPGEAAGVLRARDIAAEVVPGTQCVRVEDEDPARVLHEIRAVVQDPGASLVVPYADPGRVKWVADLCAAPGGKALALAGRGFYVLAADRSPVRLRLIVENARRTGLNVGVVAALGERPATREAPAVLVDAPCTGTGTLRRHPDARWRLRPQDVGRLAGVQARILDGAAGAVRVGGILIYSTCTLEPEEDRRQVEDFLERHPGFRVEPPEPADDRYVGLDGYLEVLPQRSGFDGAFAVRLRRHR